MWRLRGAKVACVQCHYPPGLRDTVWVKYQALTQVVKWATQTYSSKPFAEIEDGSCLRSGCHANRLLQGKVNFKRGIVFDHTPHLTQARRGRAILTLSSSPGSGWLRSPTRCEPMSLARSPSVVRPESAW